MEPMDTHLVGEKAGFRRLLRLVRAGYKVTTVELPDCAFLEHSKGFQGSHRRLMIYDDGVVVGDKDFRIRSFDSDAFEAFMALLATTNKNPG